MNLEILGINIVLMLLVLSRWAGFVMLAPLIGGKGVPAYVKLGFAIACTIVVYPLVSRGHVPPNNPLEYSMAVIQESLVGLAIGFVSQKIIFIVQNVGQLIDIQQGFSIGSLLDPVNATPASITGNLKIVLVSMLLLVTNSHYYLIVAMVRSYDYIPLLGNGPSPGLLNYGSKFIAGTFLGALQIALPVVGVLVLVEIAMGYVARTLPQMNIFFVGMPVKIGLGFFLMLWLLPLLSSEVSSLFQDSLKQIQYLYQGWGSP